MTSPQEVRETITSRVTPTRQDVVLAKAFILDHFDSSTTELLQAFLITVGAQQPEKVVLDESVNLEAQIKQVSSFLSWQLAFAEGLWGLIGAGLVLPLRENLYQLQTTQDWTTVPAGRYSKGWSFDEHKAAIPERVRLAPSAMGDERFVLSQGDLFLKELNIANMGDDVAEALEQAVACFRQALFLPAVAMLGLASEGAWTELGLSLLKVDPTNAALKAATRDKIHDILTRYDSSATQKMAEVLKLYERKDIYGEVAKNSWNYRALAQAQNWSNVVRDSRNAIHYGTDATLANTYEKVAALLLGVGPTFRIIYAIRQAAEDLA